MPGVFGLVVSPWRDSNHHELNEMFVAALQRALWVGALVRPCRACLKSKWFLILASSNSRPTLSPSRLYVYSLYIVWCDVSPATADYSLCSISGSSKTKLALFSSHDSMIMPLLVAMGLYEWEWPPYAAYIAYELWRHKTTRKYYIKVLYNGKVPASC